MDALRSFECVTADGVETVEIKDILVHDDIIHLVVKGQREEPYVFELNGTTGMRCARPDRARMVLSLHSKEILRWQNARTS